jgi:hypothetical protein
MATKSSKVITPVHQSFLLYSMDGTQYKEQVTVHQSLKGAQLLVNHGCHGKCLYLFMCQYRDAGPGVRPVLHINICVIGVLFQSHYILILICLITGAVYLKEEPPLLPSQKDKNAKAKRIKKTQNLSKNGSVSFAAGNAVMGVQMCMCDTGKCFLFICSPVYINSPPRTNEMLKYCTTCLFSSGLPFNLSFFPREFF